MGDRHRNRCVSLVPVFELFPVGSLLTSASEPQTGCQFFSFLYESVKVINTICYPYGLLAFPLSRCVLELCISNALKTTKTGLPALYVMPLMVEMPIQDLLAKKCKYYSPVLRARMKLFSWQRIRDSGNKFKRQKEKNSKQKTVVMSQEFHSCFPSALWSLGPLLKEFREDTESIV